jgi:RNA polymerase sigma-70 factor (ECF subfamily)
MLNHFRDHKKFSDQPEFDQPTSQTPEETMERQELKKQIDNAIRKMPEKRQTAFRLCYLQGFSYKEAAVTMNISEKTVENHMGLAFKDLRRALHSLRT